MYHEAKNDDWLSRLQSQDSNERETIMDGTNFELVGDFMEAFGQAVETQPTWPDFSTRELRVDLIQEEVDELVEAIANKDMVEIADALADILYVVYGAGHTFGIDLDECFTEVHASNMSKLGEDGTPIKADNGKVMKGPGFFAPDLESILNQ
jgi:predicted HAD superfamily Cof-like phosphohydrolase